MVIITQGKTGTQNHKIIPYLKYIFPRGVISGISMLDRYPFVPPLGGVSIERTFLHLIQIIKRHSHSQVVTITYNNEKC